MLRPFFNLMKMMFRSLAGLLLLCLSAAAATNMVPVAPDDSAVRQKLSQAILSSGAGQQQLLNELGDTGSKLVSEVLLAWTRDGVYFYSPPDGSKIPVMLEEQQDADGKARAIRLVDGQPVKDEAGRELRFTDSDLTAVDTDMRLRSAIQQTLDMLALSNPDPDARWSAITKISNSQKESYIPILQARQTKETDERVKKAIYEAVALLQLADNDPAVKINAIQQLAALGSIGSLAELQKIAGGTNASPEVIQAAKKTVTSIQEHIWWVNFFGTIFRGLSLGSILLVVALGLAITFGLMGVIK